MEYNDEGRFASVDRTVALKQVIKAMADTPQGAWIGGNHFGIQDLLEEARGSEEGLRKIAREANEALAEVGMRCRIERVRQSNQAGNSVASFELQISWNDGVTELLDWRDEQDVA